MINIIMAIMLYICVWITQNKNKYIEFIQMHRPKWYPDCVFCTGAHTGIIIGFITALFIKQFI